MAHKPVPRGGVHYRSDLATLTGFRRQEPLDPDTAYRMAYDAAGVGTRAASYQFAAPSMSSPSPSTFSGDSSRMSTDSYTGSGSGGSGSGSSSSASSASSGSGSDAMSYGGRDHTVCSQSDLVSPDGRLVGTVRTCKTTSTLSPARSSVGFGSMGPLQFVVPDESFFQGSGSGSGSYWGSGSGSPRGSASPSSYGSPSLDKLAAEMELKQREAEGARRRYEVAKKRQEEARAAAAAAATEAAAEEETAAATAEGKASETEETMEPGMSNKSASPDPPGQFVFPDVVKPGFTPQGGRVLRPPQAHLQFDPATGLWSAGVPAAAPAHTGGRARSHAHRATRPLHSLARPLVPE